MVENTAIDPWRLLRRGKSPGAAAVALHRGQVDNTTGETAGKTAAVPTCPQVPTVPRCLVLQGG